MTFYFAWVAPGTAFNAGLHSVEDEQVFGFQITHSEGDFPELAIDIQNPRVNLLGEYRPLWAWLSRDGSPLFYGRLVAMPDQIVREIVRLNFIARPQDYDEQKQTLADTLKTAPYWDPIWIKEQQRDDPDVVLEARPELWHIDRLTHVVSSSNINVGEDGTVNFGSDTAYYDSVNVKYGAAPLRRCSIKATISWDQTANGTLDFTNPLLAAFNDAGSPSKVASSYTGQGLQTDWPKQNANFNGGWSVGAVTLKRLDGKSRSSRSKLVKVDNANPVTDPEPGSAASSTVAIPAKAQFFVWEFRPFFPLNYNVKRKRVETVSFTLEADVQPLVVEPGEDEAELITLATKVGDQDPNDPYSTPPIGDLRRSSYMITDAGVTSLEYLILLARAHLLARARAVTIEFQVPFASGTALTCRKNASITDPRLPGGSAFGKITEYQLSVDGNSGAEVCTVKLGCTIGEGNVVVPDSGEPVYVAEGYVNLGYQLYFGGQLALLDDQITYGEYRDTPILDDGINFLNLLTADVTNSLTVINGEDEQDDVLSQRYPDIPAAIEALNAKFTEVVLDLKPLTGGPFQTDFVITTSDLMIPKTIEL